MDIYIKGHYQRSIYQNSNGYHIGLFKVVNVEVPDENIVTHMSGRRACVYCGATYHLVYAPTKEEGICDKCGGGLILRDDDKPETVQ